MFLFYDHVFTNWYGKLAKRSVNALKQNEPRNTLHSCARVENCLRNMRNLALSVVFSYKQKQWILSHYECTQYKQHISYTGAGINYPSY